MATIENVSFTSMRAIAIKYGLLTLLALIAYFLLMWDLNLIKYTSLHFVNYVFIFIGMYLTLKELRKQDHNHRTDYLPGMGVLYMYAAFVSVSFGFIMMITTWQDTTFHAQLASAIPHWGDLTPPMIGFEVASEVFLFSVIMALTVLMLFKRNRMPNNFKIMKRNEEAKHSHVTW